MRWMGSLNFMEVVLRVMGEKIACRKGVMQPPSQGRAVQVRLWKEGGLVEDNSNADGLAY